MLGILALVQNGFYLATPYLGNMILQNALLHICIFACAILATKPLLAFGFSRWAGATQINAVGLNPVLPKPFGNAHLAVCLFGAAQAKPVHYIVPICGPVPTREGLGRFSRFGKWCTPNSCTLCTIVAGWVGGDFWARLCHFQGQQWRRGLIFMPIITNG